MGDVIYDEEDAKDFLYQCAENGASWADEIKPGWYELISIPSLDMKDANVCIAGQIFFEEAREEDLDNGYLFVAGQYGDNLIDSHGMNLPDEVCGYHSTGWCWSVLAEAWIMEIEKRRANAGTML